MKARSEAVFAAIRKARRAIVAAATFPVIFYARKWLSVELDEDTVRVLTDAALSWVVYLVLPAAKAADEVAEGEGDE